MAVATMAQESEDPDLQSSISRAILLRSSHLRSQMDSMTLTSVRRLLEQDLGMKPLQLDAQKALIKTLVDKTLNSEDHDAVLHKPTKRRRKNTRVVEDLQDEDLETGRSDDLNGNSSKVEMVPEKAISADEKTVSENTSLAETFENEADHSEKPGKGVELDINPPERLGKTNSEEPDKQTKKEKNGSKSQQDDPDSLKPAYEEKTVKEGDANDVLEETAEVLAEQSSVLPQDAANDDILGQSRLCARNVTETDVQSAFMKREDELKSQEESLTMSKVRHLLEDDLGLPPKGLDVHKGFITKLVDELLLRADCINPLDIEKTTKKSQGAKKVRSLAKIESTSRGGKMSLQSEEEVKTEEKSQGNGEMLGSESEEEKEIKKRQKKAMKEKRKTHEKEKVIVMPKKVTEVKRPFSAKVERLREILKSAGIGVPPAIYRKAKLATEDERDDVLIKELENRLLQEGLSSNPTEKEIRKMKARLEKKRDLDGIESSNIVAEPRRSRASANSWFTPRQSTTSADRNVDEKTTEAEDSDDDGDARPQVTGPMDD